MITDIGPQSLSAFNRCPNQSLALTAKNTIGEQDYVVVCPRFPEGRKFTSASYIDSNPRKQLATVGMGCHECPFSGHNKDEFRRKQLVEMLHPEIGEMCGALFIAGHYPQAVLFGNLVVKERMRDMTGYETTTQAKGKGGLYFPGAPEHVDGMQQDAVSFLLMSIDASRNRLAHSRPEVHEDPMTSEKIAYGQLSVSSLAMFYLDTAEIRTQSR